MVNIDPGATADAYNALGNVLVDSAAGAPAFSVTGNDNFPAGTTISAFDATSTGGGSVTMVTSGAALGQFTYDPPRGLRTGTDGFTYTLSRNGRTATATVTFTLAGRVWFIDSTAGACPGAPCDGRRSHPYTSTALFQAANTGVGNNPAANDSIFIDAGSGSYNGALVLLAGQRLIGEGAAASLATLAAVAPQNGQTLPATGGARPVLTAAATVLTLATGNSLHGLELGNGTLALSGTNFVTLTVNDNVVINGNGQALALNNGVTTANFGSVSSSGGTNNVALTALGAGSTLALGGGALSGASAGAFVVSGGAGTISSSATISKTSAGRIVDIGTRTAGSVTLSGALTCNTACTGININANSGGSVTFSGAGSSLSTGTAQAVTLATNTGSTIDFSGGGLAITTTTGLGFGATGGGTIGVSGSGNTIDSSGGQAMNVDSTAIAAGGLSFQRISSNGGANGIVLNATGAAGGLTVTGTGAAGSGGVIQNKTARGVSATNSRNLSLSWMTFTNTATTNGADPANALGTCGVIASGGSNTGCNAAVFLNTVTNATLDRITIGSSAQQGINLNLVDGFTLSNSSVTNCGNETREVCLNDHNARGTHAIVGSTLQTAFHNVVTLEQSGGTLAAFSLLDSVVSGAGNLGIGAEVNGAATVTLFEIRETAAAGACQVANNFSLGAQVIVQGTATITRSRIEGCAFTANQVAFDIVQNIDGNQTFFARNNNIQNHVSHGMNLFAGGGGAGTQGVFEGRIENNTIGTNGVNDSGSRLGNGIRVNINEDSNAAIAVSGNLIDEVPNARGIEVIGRDLATAGGNGRLDITASAGNSIAPPAGTNPPDIGCGAGVPCPLAPLFVQSNAVASQTFTVCADIAGNTVYDPGTFALGGEEGITMRETTSGGGASTNQLEGTQATANAQLAASNTCAGACSATSDAPATVAIAGPGTCQDPPLN
jgi:hypothetical protein